ncbi:MAG: fibronectin type III domain-containing protein [bacterium]
MKTRHYFILLLAALLVPQFAMTQTPCAPEALPFVEGFEGTVGMPACWSTMAGSAGTLPQRDMQYKHSGSYGVKLNGGSVVLPLIDAPIDSLELSFWAKNGTTNASLDLYVGVVAVDSLGISTFIPVDTIAVSHYVDWVPVVIRLDHYSGPSGRLAIKTAIDYITYMYIDDVAVHRISSCPTVLSVTTSQVTDTAATVHWLAGGATGYEVAYGLAGFTIDASHIVGGITADSVTLGGLLPYTVYDVYVRSLCGGEYANWSMVRSFRTWCSPFSTLPYAEDFDSYSGNPKATELPCWRGDVGPNTCVCGLPYGGGHSGGQALRWWWSSYDETEQYATLPPINTVALPLSTLQLSFWATNMVDTYNLYEEARVVVGVMSDPEDLATFQPVDTVNILGYDWHRYDVPLSGTGQYVAIRSIPGDGTRGQWVAFIDDLLIDLAPSCPNVTGLKLTGLTATSVTVRWDNGTPGATWQAVIGTSPSDISNPSPLPSPYSFLTSPECTFDGLVAETPYYVWVRAICPIGKGDTSEWEGPLMVMLGAWNMRPYHSDTLTTCGILIYDDGGRDGDFSTQISQLVVMPDIPHHLIRVSGQSILMCTAASLTIYDGVGTSGAILWNQSVNDSYNVDFGPVVSESGPVTVKFEVYGGANQGFVLNISCIPDTCVVHHLRLDPTVAASDTALALTWECNGASFYEVEYGPVGFAPGTGTRAITSTNSFVITGLSPFDRREVRVRSVCSEDAVGEWVRSIFTTQPCANAVFRENFDSTLVENPIPAGPIGFNGSYYSYVQTLIPPEYLAGLEDSITALAFRPMEFIEADHLSRVTVWLANVPDTDLAGGPIQHDSRFVKVIDAGNFCHMPTDEWQPFGFNCKFTWDGHSTILVAALREDGAGGMRTEYSAHYRYNDVINSIARAYYIVSYYPIGLDSIRYYSEPYYNAYGTFLTGDIRLYTHCRFADAPSSDIPADTTTVGIAEPLTPHFSLYPNPTTSSVTIQSPWTLASAILTDMIGRRKEVRLTPKGYSSNNTITQSSNRTYTLDLTGNPKGAYFLILTATDGQQHTAKLIKQ